MSSTRHGSGVSGVRGAATEVTRLGTPFLVGAFVSALSGLVDTAMMGHYGRSELAAVAAGSAVFDVLATTALAAVISYQILAPRFVGRGDPVGLAAALRGSVWFSGAVALIATGALVLGVGPIIGMATGGDVELVGVGSEYLLARSPSIVLAVAFTLLTASFNAFKEPRFGMRAAIVVNAVNLLLDSLFIFGLGPLPELGALGNGLATSVSWAVGICYLLLAARRHGLRKRMREGDRDLAPPDFQTSVPRIAWPAMVAVGVDYGSLAVLFAIVGMLGQSELGGVRIAFQIMVLAYGLGSAYSAAVRILVGRALGEEKPAVVRQTRTGAVALLLGASVLIALLLAALRGPVALAFTSIPDVVETASATILVVSATMPLIALTQVSASVLRAFGKTQADMFANLVPAIVVQLPIAWLLGVHLGWGAPGAFVGVLAYYLVRTVITHQLANAAVIQFEKERAHDDTVGTGVGTN